MRSYYDLMRDSEVKAEDGTAYPDVVTLPTTNFSLTAVPQEHVVSSTDISRPDVMVGTVYGSSDYYDIILDINQVEYMKNASVGDTIYLPSLRELDDFYLRNH